MSSRRRTSVSLALFAAATLAGGALPAAAADDPAVTGVFGPLFSDPAGHECTQAQEIGQICKPAAMALAALPNGRFMYYDGLEGMNDVQLNVVAEFGNVARNDLSRVLDVSGNPPSWAVPDPVSGGANPNGNDNSYLPGVPHNNDSVSNDGDLFCSALTYLADGRVLVTGGTSYYLEPGISGVGFGATELEGLKNTRIFNPADNSWTQSGSMTYGRWYPTQVTLADGTIFVASGVTKLIKPVYPDRPADSGTNVKQTETYDQRTGTWTVNPATADKSLPLFPRLHVLPDGNVFYDAAGQTFNPFGQSYDEATWNTASVYNTTTKSWRDVGIPVTRAADAAGTAVDVPTGFRGSAFSVMLPLTRDAEGNYTKAQFLSAGGVLGVSPGSYLATATSTIDTVDTAGGADVFSSASTGPLQTPRWYGTGVGLPNGEVLVLSGADRDEVVNPGSGTPVKTVELFDPATRTWRTVGEQAHGRTYHNTAVLMDDGRVLIGGHAPIATAYAFQTDAGTQTAGLSRSTSDPSFQIYSPPYLFYGPRPAITAAPDSARRGSAITVGTPDARSISSVRLVRNTAVTHLVAGDQRTVDVPFSVLDDGSIAVTLPDNAAVLPDGPYQLFVQKRYDQGETPSVARQFFVGDGAAPGVLTGPAPAAVVPEVPSAVLLPLGGMTAAVIAVLSVRAWRRRDELGVGAV